MKGRMGAGRGWKGKWVHVSFWFPIIWITFLCLRTSRLVCLVGKPTYVPTGGLNIGMSDTEKPGQFRAHFGGGGILCSVAMVSAMAHYSPRDGSPWAKLFVWHESWAVSFFTPYLGSEPDSDLPIESVSFSISFYLISYSLVGILLIESHDRHKQYIRVWGWGQAGVLGALGDLRFSLKFD